MFLHSPTSLHPTVTTPKTDALFVLTSLSKELLFVCCIFLLYFFFFLPPSFTSVHCSRGFLAAQKHQHSPSRLCLMTYITFTLHGGTAALHVCARINYGVNDSNKRGRSRDAGVEKKPGPYSRGTHCIRGVPRNP